MAASLLIRVTEPVLDYILTVIVVLLYYGLDGLFPFTLLFLSSVGASLANFFYDDVESNRWKLAATASGMFTLTVLICLARLLWSYIHAYYFWTIDMDKLAAAITGIPESGVQFCFICAVVLMLLGCWVELFQQSVFGINPYAQPAEPELQSKSETSDTQSETAANNTESV